MMTKGYEALVILKASGTEQELARQAASLEDPIKKVGGKLDSAQSLGRRKLAFRISRQTEGHYHLLRFQAPAEQLGELERLFRLHESIVRFMIVAAEEGAPVGTRQDGQAVSGVSSRAAAASTRS